MLLPQKNWVDWIRTRWEKITISKIHILKKNRKAKKHNFFTSESYSKASGINFHILSKYHIGFRVAHRETTKPIPINNKHKRYQTLHKLNLIAINELPKCQFFWAVLYGANPFWRLEMSMMLVYTYGFLILG